MTYDNIPLVLSQIKIIKLCLREKQRERKGRGSRESEREKEHLINVNK